MVKRILVPLAIVVVAVIGYRMFAAKTPAVLSQVQNATVDVIHSQVFTKSATGTYQEIQGSASVLQGDSVKTSSSGEAIIRYPNGTTTVVNANTEVQIASFADSGNTSVVNLIGGSILSKVKNLLGTGQTSYQVQTDHIVASVRGTIFITSLINGQSTVYGVEGTVHARRPNQSENEGADVVSGHKVLADTTTAPITKSQQMTSDDYRKDYVRADIVDQVQSGDIRDNQRAVVEQFLKQLEQSNTDRKDIHDAIEQRIKELHASPSPSASPAVTSSPRPSTSSTPKPSATPEPTTTPTPIPSPTATQPVATPTPVPAPTLKSVVPNTVAAGDTVAINGSNFLGASSIRQVAAVAIGGQSIPFSVIDTSTIFATVPSLGAGTYDVSIDTAAGTHLTLPNALTVQ